MEREMPARSRMSSNFDLVGGRHGNACQKEYGRSVVPLPSILVHGFLFRQKAWHHTGAGKVVVEAFLVPVDEGEKEVDGKKEEEGAGHANGGDGLDSRTNEELAKGRDAGGIPVGGAEVEGLFAEGGTAEESFGKSEIEE